MKPDFTVVREFEKQVAEFFCAPHAVAVDSCTHGIELALRYTGAKEIIVPKHTYLSVAMLAEKLKIKRIWSDAIWQDYYELTDEVTDAAVLWQNDAYIHDTFMCISFQYQKHLSLGRGGMILCDDEYAAQALRKMAYDGREPCVPWRDQDIDTMGYHYYMTPDTALEGLHKLPEAIATPPRQWNVNDWPDISQMKIFQDTL